MINNIKIEVCCGSVDDCIVAENCHADRIELNHALELGGLTPSLGTLIEARKHTALPICCMVRPRGFGFCYGDNEVQAMLIDARLLLDHGAAGIVFGFLHADGTIDAERTRLMVETVHPHEAIFHKAFDSTEDLEASLKVLISCGVDRVLTSGGAVYPDLESGMAKIADLQRRYGKQIQILPGGGVRVHNVQDILSQTGCTQIHMTAKHLVVDPSILHYPQPRAEKASQYVATEAIQLQAIMAKIAEM